MSVHPAKWAVTFVRLRWYLLSLACVVTLLASMYAPRLTFNFSSDNIYLAKDPSYRFYVSHFLPEFGHGANVCLIAVDGDIKTAKVQSVFKELHSALEKVPQIESVRSIVNTSVFVQKDGSLQSVPIFDETGAASSEMLDWAAGDPAMQNLLISKDARIATISVTLPLKLADQDSADKISLDLKKVIDGFQHKYPDLKFYIAGTPILQLEAIATLKGDQVQFLPITVLLMAALLWLSFRSLRGMVLPFIATGTAALWAMAWLVLMGHSLDIVNNKLVVLLLVIGSSCAVQLFARYQDELYLARKNAARSGTRVSHDDVIAHMVQAMALPCFLTTLIAALGFGSVAVSQVSIIRHFGIDAAVGIMGSYVSTMLIVPAVLRLLPLPKERERSSRKNRYFPSIDNLLGAVARFSMDNPKLILGVALVVAACGIYLAKDIRANQRLASELPNDAASVVAIGFLEKNLTGILPFEIVFEGNPSRLTEPDVIRAGARIEEFMSHHALAPVTRSFADLLLSIDRSLSAGQTLEPVSKWSDEKLAQLSLLFDFGDPKLVKEVRQEFYSADGKYYRFQGLLKDASTTTLGEFREAVREEIAKIKLPGVNIHLTGSAMITTNALDHIISSTIASLAVAVIAIFVLVLILFRSFSFALIALFPNLVPIIVSLASMQAFGVSLRVATVMIFSMALGIAVDACVYLITRFREEAVTRRAGQESEPDSALRATIERTMRGSGRPVVYTTFMLLAGFSALSISRFGAIRDFAILSSITLSTAVVVDLLLWPALVILVKPKLAVTPSKK